MNRPVLIAFCFVLSVLTAFSPLNAQTNDPSPEAALKILLEQGKNLKDHTPREALTFFEEALSLSEAHDLRKVKPVLIKEIGSCYFNLHDYNKALSFYEESLQMGKAMGDSSLVAQVLFNIGKAKKSLHLMREALEYYLQAYQVDLSLGDSIGIGYDLNQIGVIYYDLREFGKADSLLHVSLNLRKRLGHQLGVGFTSINISNNYSAMGKQSLAVTFAEKAVRIFEKSNDKLSHIDALIALGNAHNMMKQFEQAEKNYLAVIELNKGTGAYEEELKAILNVGFTRLEMSDLEGVKECIAKAQSILDDHELNVARYLYQIAQLHYETEKVEGDFEAALIWYERYHTDYIQWMEDRDKEKIDKLEMQSLLKKKEEEIGGLKLKNELVVKEQGYRENIIIITATSAVLILSLMAFLLQSRHRVAVKEKMQREEIEKKNTEISFINDNLNALVRDRTQALEEQKETLLKMNAQLQEIAYLNAHKTRAPLARILGLLEIDSYSNTSFTPDELLSMLKREAEDLDSTIKSISLKIDDSSVDQDFGEGLGHDTAKVEKESV